MAHTTAPQAGTFHDEVSSGERFTFGENWRAFLETLNEQRIATAQASLCDMLGVKTLEGRSFLDIGSGSGLFSLVARRLGARVHSIDFDPASVACTRELRERYFPGDPDWTIAEGSVLDRSYLESLGTFDIVYSWGVLHHTGEMWRAVENAIGRVKPGGRLFIAIYNFQHRWSGWWQRIKSAYCHAPDALKPVILYPVAAKLWGPRMIRDFVKLQPFKTWNEYRRERGMSPWHDIVDWVGGYPFEVAKPEEVFDFCRARGFTLLRLRTEGGGLGCNEFVFERSAEAPTAS